MKKNLFVVSAVVLVAVALVIGVKRVPDGREMLRVSRDGKLRSYEAGWHFIPPGDAELVYYPVGRTDYRFPRRGDLHVLLENGDPAAAAFSVALSVPRGSGTRIYERFTEQFDMAVGRLVESSAEIVAAETRSDASPAGFSKGVERLVRDELARLGVDVVRFDLVRWGGAEVDAEKKTGRGGPVRKVILIGVDGGDWRNIAPLVADGKLPNFKRLIERGATGPLRSIQPLLSPLLWTTIATGKYPEDHGILNFTVMDEAKGRKVPVTRHYRKVDAFWNFLGDYGRKVDVIGWLATYPAERVNGVMVTDKVGYLSYAPQDRDEAIGAGVFPADRIDEIQGHVVHGADVRFEEIEPMLHISRDEFERHRKVEFDPKDSINDFIMLYASTNSFRNIALGLIDTDRPDLIAVYFEWVDAVSHLFTLHAPPRLPDVDPEQYRRFRDAVSGAYVRQDAILGEFMDRLDDRTVLIVVSDHGFKSGGSRLKNRPEIWAGNAAKWHRLDGIVALYGNGVRTGRRIEGATILDIAPTILALQGLPRAADMPGKPILDAFESEITRRFDPNTVGTFERERDADQANAGQEAAGAATEETMKKLEALGYITPDNADAHNNLGMRYQERGEFLKAIEEYQKALAMRRDRHDVYNNLAVCYGKLKRYADSERVLLKAIELQPGDFYAMNNLAITYLETGRTSQARQMAERAVAAEPGYVNGRVTLGSIYATAGDFRLAEEQFAAALELEPDNSNAARNLDKVRKRLESEKR